MIISEKIGFIGAGKMGEALINTIIKKGVSTTQNISASDKRKDRLEYIKKETVIIKDAVKEITPILGENKNKHIIVKCDCEGAEFEIFERLNEEKLIGNIDVILMEYHFNKPDGLVSVLTKNGFAVRTKVLSKKMSTGYIYAVRMTEK